MQFHFEMFAFLSQVLDVHPNIYLIICCTMLVLWLHVAFINCDADQTNRLDVDSVHEKMQTLTFPNNSNHLGIPSIKGRKTLNCDSGFHFRMHFMQIKFYIYVQQQHQKEHPQQRQRQSNATDFPQILKQILWKNSSQQCR